jgi:hypothetical protein
LLKRSESNSSPSNGHQAGGGIGDLAGMKRQRVGTFCLIAHDAYGLLAMVYDIAEVAKGNWGSRETAMRKCAGTQCLQFWRTDGLVFGVFVYSDKQVSFHFLILRNCTNPR